LQVDEFADDGGGKKGKGKKDAKKEGMMADKEEAALRKAEAKKLAEDEEESLSTVREPHPNPSPLSRGRKRAAFLSPDEAGPHSPHPPHRSMWAAGFRCSSVR
jgi:hypothetical protein